MTAPSCGIAIELFEVLMRIRRDRGDAVTLHDAEPRKTAAPSVAAFAKLPIGEPKVAVDHRFARGIQLACAARKIQRRERGFHGVALQVCL